jgi:hypothetical protein
LKLHLGFHVAAAHIAFPPLNQLVFPMGLATWLGSRIGFQRVHDYIYGETQNRAYAPAIVVKLEHAI